MGEDGMEWIGMGCDGVGWMSRDGMGGDGMGHMVWSGMGVV